ncbi:MAG: DUF5915 domain-containing protein, partial [Candidatus Heimdallarchaeota archaeon]
LQVDNQITVYYHGSDKILAAFDTFAEYIKSETLTTELRKTTKKTTNKIVILGEELFISIEKNK